MADPKTTVVRILVATPIDGTEYKPNILVELPDKVAKDLVKQGAADDSPEAVAYLTGEGVTPVVHQAV